MSQLLLGPFTEQERQSFINQSALNYLMKHPEERPSYARRRARIYWAKYVKKHATIKK